MAKKQFGLNGLNSLNKATETISTALETQVITELLSPQNDGIGEQLPVIAPITEQSKSKAKETKPKTKGDGSKSSEICANADEKVKIVNVKIPMSLYRRLNALKLDSGDTMQTISILAIEAFLKKKGY